MNYEENERKNMLIKLKRLKCSRNGLKEGEEKLKTIGGAEAAAFHAAWHRLSLKSLLFLLALRKL